MRATIRPAIAALVLAPTLVAWTAYSNLTLQPQSRLWVTGSSTVRSFECKAGTLETSVEAEGAGAVQAVLAGQKAVKTVVVKVLAAKLDCANGTMNGHMMKAIKGAENPVIEFRVASYDVEKGAAGVTGTLSGTLSLGGQQKPITVVAAGRREADGSLRVTGTHELKMTEYGLKPPSLMMGTMKVDNKVTVHFDLLLKE
jgi:polyisoprenoid-binding protein YceI